MSAPFLGRVTSTPANANTWRCDVCGRPIADRQGYLEFVDPATGGYPSLSDSAEAQYHEALWKFQQEHMARHPEQSGTAALEFWQGSEPGLPPRRPHAKLVVVHRRCDPHPEAHSYWIEIERAQDPVAVLDWVMHLLEKTWFGLPETREFIQRYRTGACAADVNGGGE